MLQGAARYEAPAERAAGCRHRLPSMLRAPVYQPVALLPLASLLQEPTTQALYIECFDRDYLNAKVGGGTVTAVEFCGVWMSWQVPPRCAPDVHPARHLRPAQPRYRS